MTFTHQNKKGVVLVELIASVIIMGLVSTMLMSIIFFTFKSLDLTSTTTKQNETAMAIAQSISNIISDWNPTDINVSASDNGNNKIIFTRNEFFYDTPAGITIRVELKDGEIDQLTLEFIKTGTDTGKIKFTHKINHEYDPNLAKDSEEVSYVDTNNFSLNLYETTITYSALTKEVGGGVTEVTSYLVKMNIVTESPSKVEVPISIPVIVKK